MMTMMIIIIIIILINIVIIIIYISVFYHSVTMFTAFNYNKTNNIYLVRAERDARFSSSIAKG